MTQIPLQNENEIIIYLLKKDKKRDQGFVPSQLIWP